MKGVVKFYQAEKNFGFLTPDPDEPRTVDVYVSGHQVRAAGLHDTLKAGDRVTFELGEYRGKLEARDIAMADDPEDYSAVRKVVGA